jgi:acetyl esterase/lipase
MLQAEDAGVVFAANCRSVRVPRPNRSLNVVGFIVSALLLLRPQAATAQETTRNDNQPSPSTAAPNVYDSSDHDQIRLWDGPAPGASGNDPRRDIPFLRVYRAPARDHALGSAVLLIPGGGYDRLSDRKEQAPVAEYFSQKLRGEALGSHLNKQQDSAAFDPCG